MRTPIIEMLAVLAPNVVRVVCELSEGDKEELEKELQDKLNAEFGDTLHSVEVLENLHDALKDVLKGRF